MVVGPAHTISPEFEVPRRNTGGPYLVAEATHPSANGLLFYLETVSERRTSASAIRTSNDTARPRPWVSNCKYQSLTGIGEGYLRISASGYHGRHGF